MNKPTTVVVNVAESLLRGKPLGGEERGCTSEREPSEGEPSAGGKPVASVVDDGAGTEEEGGKPSSGDGRPSDLVVNGEEGVERW